jgi:hypothetical protein
MNGVRDPDLFTRLIAALEPWLGQVVIVGGWVHRLYRLHPHAQLLDYPPLSTLDADVAVPAQLPVGEQDIRARFAGSWLCGGVFRRRSPTSNSLSSGR